MDMRNKKGVLLIASLLIISVLGVLLVSFFFKAAGENEMSMRYAHASRALWLAETGIAQVIGNPGIGDQAGQVDDPNYTYTALVSHIVANYYRAVSTGSVVLSTGKVISRQVEAIIRTGAVDPTKFGYGIETTTDLITKGAAYTIDPSDSWKEYSVLDFADLFGITKAEMKANATHLYDDANFSDPVDGITWVDVTVGDELVVGGNLIGSGILVVNGDAHFTGTIVFSGIIYVIGELVITGTVTTNGAVLAESDATVDTELKGTVNINYSPSDIADALNWVSFITKEVVAWKEK